MSGLFSSPKVAAPPPPPGPSAAEIASARTQQRRQAANRMGREASLLGGSTGGQVTGKKLLGQ